MGRLVGVGSVYDSGTVELSFAEVGIILWISKIKEERLRKSQRMNIVFGLWEAKIEAKASVNQKHI